MILSLSIHLQWVMKHKSYTFCTLYNQLLMTTEITHWYNPGQDFGQKKVCEAVSREARGCVYHV